MKVCDVGTFSTKIRSQHRSSFYKFLDRNTYEHLQPQYNINYKMAAFTNPESLASYLLQVLAESEPLITDWYAVAKTTKEIGPRHVANNA